jgi:hypothetical protein
VEPLSLVPLLLVPLLQRQESLPARQMQSDLHRRYPHMRLLRLRGVH